ncbi:D-alanyl-D-alanine carboxypeptidase family protein [Paenibacillus marinisediminis]
MPLTDAVVSLKREMIHHGHLILVNRDWSLAAQPQDGSIIPVTAIPQAGTEEQELRLERTCCLQLRAWLKACHAEDSIGIVSGYRTQAQQKHIYDTSLMEHGAEFTAKYVARPNESEHQTGLAVDVGELVEEVDYLCPSLPHDGVFATFRQLAAEYGFVQRYKEGKESITNIACEPWHYRYVGVPHAIIMEQHDLCLEEYIDFIKQFPYKGSHLYMKYKRHLIEMYYVRAEECETSIMMKSDCEYEWSGNNCDGFIVTIYHDHEWVFK